MVDIRVSIQRAIGQVETEIQNLAGLKRQLQRIQRDYRTQGEREARSITTEVMVLRIVEGAGSKGIMLKDIDERLQLLGFDTQRKTISSYLTRAQKRGEVRKYSQRWWTVAHWEQFNLENKENAIEHT